MTAANPAIFIQFVPVRARVVHRALQVLELVRVDHESLEVVVPVGVVDRALQGSGGCRIAQILSVSQGWGVS